MKLTTAAGAGAGGGRVCDLCHEQQPSLYCSSDSAFLCSDCDSQVHTANFLVARHVRFPICSLCKSYHSTTTAAAATTIACHDDDDALSSSSSSSSSTTKTIKSNKKTTSSSSSLSSSSVVSSSISSDSKTRDVLIDWCTRVVGGDSNSSSSSEVIIEVARHAFQAWWQDGRRRRLVWPYRVGLAASLWLGVLRSFTLNKEDYNINKRSEIRLMLKRLEEISGVPAKSIVVAQSKLAATLKHRRHQDDDQESWAEC